MELTKEQIEQLKACATVEDVKAFAESLGGQITDEQAAEVLNMIEERRMAEAEGKIGDDALADVSGGAWDWGAFVDGFLISAFGVGITCAVLVTDTAKKIVKKTKSDSKD